VLPTSPRPFLVHLLHRKRVRRKRRSPRPRKSKGEIDVPKEYFDLKYSITHSRAPYEILQEESRGAQIFKPIRINNPIGAGDLIKRLKFKFKITESRRYFFDFPFIDEYGFIKPHTCVRLTCTSSEFFIRLVSTVYFRLHNLAKQFKHAWKLRNLLVNSAVIYAIGNNDYFLSRVRGLIKARVPLEKVVVRMYRRLRPPQKVFFRSCLTALGRRTPGIFPCGGWAIHREEEKSFRDYTSLEDLSSIRIMRARLLHLWGGRVLSDQNAVLSFTLMG